MTRPEAVPHGTLAGSRPFPRAYRDCRPPGKGRRDGPAPALLIPRPGAVTEAGVAALPDEHQRHQRRQSLLPCTDCDRPTAPVSTIAFVAKRSQSVGDRNRREVAKERSQTEGCPRSERSSAIGAVSAPSRARGLTPEMPVAESEQGLRQTQSAAPAATVRLPGPA
jgi:hypothetical protein